MSNAIGRDRQLQIMDTLRAAGREMSTREIVEILCMDEEAARRNLTRLAMRGEVIGEKRRRSWYWKLKQEPRGLFGKYIISKADGAPVDPNADYFVLRIDQPENLYERRALWHYADCIAEDNPQLHADIKNRIQEHEFRHAREDSEE